MEEKQLLELILKQVTENTAELVKINSRLDKIESTQDILVRKVDGITEQLVKVSELEPVTHKLIKDVEQLETDMYLVKRAIRN